MTRKSRLPVRGKTLKLPVYFPSISSVKTGLSPYDYFKILTTLKQSHFLVSAFDVDKSFQKKEFLQILKENRNADGSIILMDSGNYESYWIRDKGWTRKSFESILQENSVDFAFCYDNQYPPEEIEINVKWIIESTLASQKSTNAASVIPIIHCKKEFLNQSAFTLCRETGAPMIAVPERILGDGILERVRTVISLRNELNKLGNYVVIHLLGTGNPLALLLFSLAGADSFDGLEWCQTVVNTRTATLHHFQHLDLVADDCLFCKSNDLDYTLKTLGHNLLFYSQWMEMIQSSLEEGTEMQLIDKYFEGEFMTKLNKIFF